MAMSSAQDVAENAAAGQGASAPGTLGADVQQDSVTIVLDGKTVTASARPGETLLETARRAGLTPPFSCEAGNCGTCMGKLTEGTASMRVNDALDDDEVEEGYTLTCQAVPEGSVTVTYDD